MKSQYGDCTMHKVEFTTPDYKRKGKTVPGHKIVLFVSPDKKEAERYARDAELRFAKRPGLVRLVKPREEGAYIGRMFYQRPRRKTVSYNRHTGVTRIMVWA